MFQAFYRWKSECLAAASGCRLSGNDTAILNVIRMREQPKSLSEIARLLNREDMSNIQYALRKLLSEGLVEKANGAARKTTTYRVTEQGYVVTERYAELRSQVLMTMLHALGDNRDRFGEVGRFLDLMAGMYDQAAGQVSARRY
ncbi:MAG TPA: winged helix DNA-binding protein [Stellaceae bacterium]|nr:winged helix DNA-binding protein [Stellaceae bacterium]